VVSLRWSRDAGGLGLRRSAKTPGAPGGVGVPNNPGRLVSSSGIREYMGRVFAGFLDWGSATEGSRRSGFFPVAQRGQAEAEKRCSAVSIFYTTLSLGAASKKTAVFHPVAVCWRAGFVYKGPAHLGFSGDVCRGASGAAGHPPRGRGAFGPFSASGRACVGGPDLLAMAAAGGRDQFHRGRGRGRTANFFGRLLRALGRLARFLIWAPGPSFSSTHGWPAVWCKFHWDGPTPARPPRLGQAGGRRSRPGSGGAKGGAWEPRAGGTAGREVGGRQFSTGRVGGDGRTSSGNSGLGKPNHRPTGGETKPTGSAIGGPSRRSFGTVS